MSAGVEAPHRAADPAAAPGRTALVDGRLGVLLLVAGVVGILASGELAIEKLRLLENPFYVPACSLGESVDCAAVMRSAQSEALGVPNPYIGLVGFGGLLTTGLVLLSGGRPGRAYWAVLQLGVTFAVVLVHWLAFQTLYRIGALCPFCMTVWAVTIPTFWYVTLRNAAALGERLGPLGAVVRGARRNHGVLATVWLLLLAAFVVERFWSPWGSVFV